MFVDTQSSTDLESEPITQVQNANQLTEQQVQAFICSRCKVRRITYKLTSINQRYGIFILIKSIMNITTSQRQIQLIMTSTKKQNPTTTIIYLPPNAYISGNQLSRNIPTQQSSNTFRHLDIQTSQSVNDFEKCPQC
jgi:hypothetical protein